MLSTGLTSCESEPFPETHDRVYGDFGTEMFQMLHDEFLWSGDQVAGESRALAFGANRQDLIWAFNTLNTGVVETSALPFLDAILPLYDPRADGSPGAMPTMTRDMGEQLDLLTLDPRTMDAMARMNTALDANPYASLRLIGGLIKHPMPLLDPLIDMTLDLEPELTELFRWLHRELPTLEDEYVESPFERSLQQRLLHTQLEVTAEPLGPPTMTTFMDGRGAPVIRRLPSGELPPPFVDTNGDGSADVDQFGRPVDIMGLPVPMPTFATSGTIGEERDQLGRAFVAGELVYEYFDVRRSVLAYVLRDVRELLADGIHFDMFSALEGLLGGRVTRQDDDGAFTGFFIESAPLLDLLYQVNELRRYPRIVQLTRALEHTAKEQGLLFRQLLNDFADVRDIFKGAPDLAATNTLFDDLHPILSSMAKHGIFRDFFAVSVTPEAQGTFQAIATMMKFTGLQLPTDPLLLDTPGQVDNLQFINPTNWDVPDTTEAQMSMMQQAAMLIADTRGVPIYLNLFDQVVVEEVVITDDMGRFYIEAIGGAAVLQFDNALLETLAVDLVHEFDSLMPSAEELNLFINHPQPSVGNPVCKQGFQVRNHFGSSLYALQASGGLRSLRPWIEKIVAKGRTDDFVALFEVLALNYSELERNDNGVQSTGTGFRKLEPYLIRAFEDTQMPDHLMRLQGWLHETNFMHNGESINVADEFDAFLNYLLDDASGATTRRGETTIVSPSGRTINGPSRLQLIVHAFDMMDEVLSQNPAAQAAWDRIDMVGQFINTDGNGNFLNPHFLELMLTLMPILAEDVAQSVSEPDWNSGIDTFISDIEDVVGSRGFTALADTLAKVRDTPRHRAFVDTLITSLFEEQPPEGQPDLFGSLLQALSTLSQIRIPTDAATQLARGMAPLMNPDKRFVFRALESLRELRARDTNGVLRGLGENLFAEPEFGQMPLRILMDGFKTAMRVAPGAIGAYSAEDYDKVIKDFAGWMRDDIKGAERLYTVIRSR